MRNSAFIIFNIVLVALVFHLVPAVRKRSLFFGVTVEDAFRQTDVAHDISRTYRLLVWSGTAGALLLLWIAIRFDWNVPVSLAPTAQVAVAIAGWVIAWRRVKPHASTGKSAERAATLGGPQPRIPGGFATILLPFLGPVAAVWQLQSRYQQLPASYPVHWNAAGHADRFADKSLLAVFFPPMMCAALLLLLALLALAIHYGSRRGTSGERAGWSSRHRRLNLLMLVSMMWILSFMLSVTSFGAVIPADTMRLLIWSSVGLLLTVVMGFSIPLLRMSMEATGGTDATPDECWRLGILYYNPNDPALIVEKRDGPGFTLNFGNHVSWAIVVLIVIITVAPIISAVWL